MLLYKERIPSILKKLKFFEKSKNDEILMAYYYRIFISFGKDIL